MPRKYTKRKGGKKKCDKKKYRKKKCQKKKKSIKKGGFGWSKKKTVQPKTRSNSGIELVQFQEENIPRRNNTSNIVGIGDEKSFPTFPDQQLDNNTDDDFEDAEEFDDDDVFVDVRI